MENILQKLNLSLQLKKHIPATKKRVIIIGGGPVGLFTGIKLLENGYSVKIIERRSTYLRKEVFMLQNSIAYETLSLLPKDLLNELYNSGCIINAPALDTYPECYKDYKQSSNATFNNSNDKIKENYPARLVGFTISTFETILANYFVKKGGKLIRPNGNTSFDVKIHTDWSIKISQINETIYPDDYDVILGAEGFNSSVRDVILNDAKNPKNGDDMEILYLINENNRPIKKNVDRTEKYLDKNNMYYLRIKKTDPDDFVGFNIGYGLVGYIKRSHVGDQNRIKDDGINIDDFIDADFNNIATGINNNTIKNTVPYLQKNKKNFINNIKSGYNDANDYFITTDEIAPQHRYRFFVSRDNEYYFGINLSRDEYDVIFAKAIADSDDPNLRNINLQELHNLPSFQTVLLSLFSFYGFMDDDNDIESMFNTYLAYYSTMSPGMHFSVFPIKLYKTGYCVSYKNINNAYKYCGIIGDSTIGVHYFSGSGVNIGIHNANLLVDMLNKFDWNKHDTNAELVKRYNDQIYNKMDNDLLQSLNVTLNWKTIKKTNLVNFNFDSINCISTSQNCTHRKNYVKIMQKLHNYIVTNKQYPPMLSNPTTKPEETEVIEEIKKIMLHNKNILQ